jgi:nitric oxide reductase subunit B
MTTLLRLFLRFTLLLLICSLLFGTLASWSFLYPETYNKFLPFYQLRPFHVSAALFWIISGAVGCVYYLSNEMHKTGKKSFPKGFMLLWMTTIIIIFLCYSLKIFGGREYWEFPPVLSIPLLTSWILLMIAYFKPWEKGAKPLYVWMWSTGILFFLITFIEQNLWQIPWFRQSFLREITVQWKANGATVGAWNQMIYGTALYLMVKISGNENLAKGWKAYFFYFLGLTNLMFNWGHHIYNVPTASWIRNVSYVISMTEFLFFVNMIQGFRSTLESTRKYKHLLTYRLIITAEFWVFINLVLVLFMSVPAVNRYTHGTHITVAHAMGTTIGINTMILLAGFSYMLKMDEKNEKVKQIVKTGYWISQISLLCFWLALIAAGILKSYRSVVLNMNNFREMMQPVITMIKIFSIAGIGVLVGISIMVVPYLHALRKPKQDYNTPAGQTLVGQEV